MSSPFEGLLGNNCELRMFEFLLPLEGVEFNITELAQEVGVSRVTATRIVKKYVDWGVLKSPRTSGNTTYYSINYESPIVKCIEQLNNVLIENILGNETLYEIHDYWEARRPHVLVGQPAVGETLIHQEYLPQVGAYTGLGDMNGLPNPWQVKEAPAKASTLGLSSTVNTFCLPGSQPPISGGAT